MSEESRWTFGQLIALVVGALFGISHGFADGLLAAIALGILIDIRYEVTK